MRKIKQTMASSSIFCTAFPLWKMALSITLPLSFGRFGSTQDVIPCKPDMNPIAIVFAN
ncbi:hypothetical protein [Holospora undulata]|uniref:hypothetical protein n=1 Tax=Holospora undulata TaxID=1169117 RepID=UPI001376742F|nr:hypothetical protein [Holospora undulata]